MSRVGRRVVLSAAAAGATLILFLASRGKWSDAVIDVGSEWAYADALARGGLLYRDVTYWFGPVTPYFLAGFFRLLGSSFRSLVVAGVVGTVGVLASLHVALRRVARPGESWIWTLAAIPSLVFMPYSGGSILGMGYRMWHAAGFSLVAVALPVGSSGRRGRSGPWIASGLAAGFAGLCRTEWGVAAVLATVVSAWTMHRRSHRRFATLEKSAKAVAAAATTWGLTMSLFAWKAGVEAVFGDGTLLFQVIPAETRHFLWEYSNVSRWRHGLVIAAGSIALWGAGFLSVRRALAPEATRERRRRAFLLWIGCTAVFVVFAATSPIWQWRALIFSAAPFLCLASLAAGVFGLLGSRGPALAGFAFLGFSMALRRPFDIQDSGYVAPPLLAALVCVAGLASLSVAAQTSREGRVRLRAGLRFAVGVLIGLSFTDRWLHYRGDRRIPVPGTDRMLSASETVSREISDLAAAISARSTAGDSLVVIPEGAVLNDLTGLSNPLRDKLLIPGYLNERNEARIRRLFGEAAPRWVVVWSGPEAWYGKKGFGVDYGLGLADDIEAHYQRQELPGANRIVGRRPAALYERRASRRTDIIEPH